MTKISPIAQYLRTNKAIPKRDKFGCHFFSPEGLYLGRLTKAIVNNYRVITLATFGEGFKRMYTKSVAIGQQYAYVKNNSAELGISIVPIKTYMRRAFVDFIEEKSCVEDSEKTLTNNLDLIAIDNRLNVGLYDTEKPFNYKKDVTDKKLKQIKNLHFNYKMN
jgi:hypothetical protein